MSIPHMRFDPLGEPGACGYPAALCLILAVRPVRPPHVTPRRQLHMRLSVKTKLLGSAFVLLVFMAGLVGATLGFRR